MANLLAHSAEGVQRRYNKAQTYLNSVRSGEDRELVDALHQMAEALLQQERELYHRIGVSNYTEFNAKLEKANIKQLDFMLSNGEVVRYYLEHYTFPKSAELDEAVDLLRALLEQHWDDINTNIEEEVVPTVGEDVTDDAIAYFRQVFKERGGKSLRILGKGKQKVGLGKLQFKLEPTTQKGVHTKKISAKWIEGANAFGPELINKVVATLSQDGEKDDISIFKSRAAFKDDVNKQILDRAPGIWRNILQTVMVESTYGVKEITRSYAGLVGYLGEVRAQAILYYFFGDEAFGTGALKEIATKADISIDMVVKQGLDYFGFQVKNYTLAENKATFSSSMSTLNFIQNRLCLTGTAEEIIGDLFGAYQFNQPFKNDVLKEKYKNAEMPVEKYESQIYLPLSNTANSLHDLILSRLGYIMRIGRSFSLDRNGDLGEIFGDERMYYNSFFLIEKEFIPSSVILREIANQIERGQMQNSAIVSYNVPKKSSPTLEEYRSKSVPTLQLLLEGQKIYYDIVLDVAQLKNKALQQI